MQHITIHYNTQHITIHNTHLSVTCSILPVSVFQVRLQLVANNRFSETNLDPAQMRLEHLIYRNISNFNNIMLINFNLIIS